jgi:DNA-binding CsgD family transcriptional regulator
MLPGRADDVARLLRLLDDARSGLSAALIVHGDPGIGKTALLDEVAAAATGFAVLRARPLQTESELPFAGLSDLLRPLMPLLDRIPAPQGAVLAGALALGPPTPGDRFAAAAATISLLATGAEEAPVLAIVDDAQWLDAPSRESLLFAGHRLGREGVVLLLAMRDRRWLDDAGLETLALRGLGAAAAAELVAATGRAVSPGVQDRLVGETGGNPLALLEALATLTDAQLGGSAPIIGPIPVGRSLERSFAQRLELLPEETRRAMLVAAASYSGDATEIAHALAAMGLPRHAPDAAERDGLIAVVAGRIEFRHPLLRSAAYHAADPVERRAAHRALAGALGPDQPDRIARHLAAAAAGPDEGVAGLLEASATAAQGRRGYAAAADALATAALLSPADADRVRRTIGAANAFWLGGQGQTAANILANVLDLTDDPLLRADMQRLRAAALMFVRPLRETFALLVDEADRVEPHDAERAAMMLAIASLGITGAAEVELSIATARRAARLAAPIGGPVALVAAISLANGLVLAGKVGEGVGILDPLIPVIETIDPLGEAGSLVAQAAHALTWSERWAPGRALLERLVSTARQASALTALPYRLAILSELELRCGRVAPAYAAATEAVQLAMETGQAVDSSIALVALARAEALLGLEAACRAHVAAALQVGRQLGMTAIENYAAAVLGALELSLGHPDRAIAHLVECARLEVEYGVGLPTVVPWNADLVESYVRLGRSQDAIRELEVLEEQARATGSRWATATAARCRGLLAEEDAFDTLLVLAIDLHGEEDPFERARTELCLGRRRRHARRRAAARVVLHQALATFEALGAEPWAEQARAELRATGETPTRTAGRSLMTLTPQELQVALVVAGGATNKEAGAALFISPKTVEFHLGHVYDKLGVRSRTELVPKVAALT